MIAKLWNGGFIKVEIRQEPKIKQRSVNRAKPVNYRRCKPTVGVNKKDALKRPILLLLLLLLFYAVAILGAAALISSLDPSANFWKLSLNNLANF